MKDVTNFQTVVDVQAGHHHQESIGVDASDKSLDDIGVPRLVCLIDQAVHSVRTQKRDSDDVQPAEGDLIIFLGLLLGLGELVLVLKHNYKREE